METSRVAENIQIEVQNRFEPDFSRPDIPNYLFSYKIHIHNSNPFPVQLLNRSWHIVDSSGEVIEVQGEGVVGLTPIIEPNRSFEYTSNVNLQSGIGKMRGYYEFRNLSNSSSFTADIPEFKLEAMFVLN